MSTHAAGSPGGRSADQGFVTQLTRSSHSNFYYSFLFLPRPQREAIHSLYAFCREVDDSADNAPDTAEASRRIAFWRAELASCYAGRATHPVTRTLAVHLRRFPIRRADLEQIIEGVAMDLQPRRYATYEDLQPYCYRVASAVGLACLEIFGYVDPASRDYAIQLGHAFQMTNILRDVKNDAERGRVYLPVEEMARFGCSEEDLRASCPTPAFLDLMRFQIARARGLFLEASRLLPAADRRSLFAARIMGAIYEAILDKIERSPSGILRGKMGLSRSHKLALAVGLFLKSRAPGRA